MDNKPTPIPEPRHFESLERADITLKFQADCLEPKDSAMAAAVRKVAADVSEIPTMLRALQAKIQAQSETISRMQVERDEVAQQSYMDQRRMLGDAQARVSKPRQYLCTECGSRVEGQHRVIDGRKCRNNLGGIL